MGFYPTLCGFEPHLRRFFIIFFFPKWDKKWRNLCPSCLRVRKKLSHLFSTLIPSSFRLPNWPWFHKSEIRTQIKRQSKTVLEILIFCRFEGGSRMFSMYSDKRRCRLERYWSMCQQYKPLQIWRFFSPWFDQKSGEIRRRERQRRRRKVRILKIWFRGCPYTMHCTYL